MKNTLFRKNSTFRNAFLIKTSLYFSGCKAQLSPLSSLHPLKYHFTFYSTFNTTKLRLIYISLLFKKKRISFKINTFVSFSIKIESLIIHIRYLTILQDDL